MQETETSAPQGEPPGPRQLQGCPSPERSCPPPLIFYAVCTSIGMFLVSSFIRSFIQILGEHLPQLVAAMCQAPRIRLQCLLPSLSTLHSTLATGSPCVNAPYFPLELMYRRQLKRRVRHIDTSLTTNRR